MRFVEGDVQALDGFDTDFDAIVGRLVLMYLPDPVAALRRVRNLLRPGGPICVQEGDMAYDCAQPMTPRWTPVRASFIETLTSARVAPRMGLSLHASFIAAGLPAPELRLECAISGRHGAWGRANIILGILPLMERLGVTTAAEVATRSPNACNVTYLQPTGS